MLTWVSADMLRAHVGTLAGEIGERNVFRPGALHAAADFIAAEWEAQGYLVGAQVYEVHGVACSNLEVTRPGARTPDEIIVIGATTRSPAAPGPTTTAAAWRRSSKCPAGSPLKRPRAPFGS